MHTKRSSNRGDNGYLVVASDGGIFNFSPSPFRGSLGAHPPDVPITAIATSLVNRRRHDPVERECT